MQRCTLHKHRNLLHHAPDRLHDEITADYTDMIFAATAEDIAARRKAFLRNWRLKCKAVADSLEEASERLFTFTRPPQWRSARTTSGRCSPPARSTCSKSTAGRRSLASPSINQLNACGPDGIARGARGAASGRASLSGASIRLIDFAAQFEMLEIAFDWEQVVNDHREFRASSDLSLLAIHGGSGARHGPRRPAAGDANSIRPPPTN